MPALVLQPAAHTIQESARTPQFVGSYTTDHKGDLVKRVTPVILAASALLLVLDIVGALVRHPLGFPYSPVGIVCILTYFSVGLVAAWREGVAVGVAAAAVVGLLDGTLGPLAAWFVGRGALSQTIEEPGIFAYGITVFILTAAGTGLVGALAGIWLGRRRGLRARVLPH
jgi:hypothetical protein